MRYLLLLLTVISAPAWAQQPCKCGRRGGDIFSVSVETMLSPGGDQPRFVTFRHTALGSSSAGFDGAFTVVGAAGHGLILIDLGPGWTWRTSGSLLQFRGGLSLMMGLLPGFQIGGSLIVPFGADAGAGLRFDVTHRMWSLQEMFSLTSVGFGLAIVPRLTQAQ